MCWGVIGHLRAIMGVPVEPFLIVALAMLPLQFFGAGVVQVCVCVCVCVCV